MRNAVEDAISNLAACIIQAIAKAISEKSTVPEEVQGPEEVQEPEEVQGPFEPKVGDHVSIEGVIIRYDYADDENPILIEPLRSNRNDNKFWTHPVCVTKVIRSN